MANPQPDSFTRLSNEILKQILISKFSKRQIKILKLIWRCSYGFNKKVARLLKSDYKAAGIDPSDIKEELIYLEKARVIYWDEENDLVAFNKDYDQWRISLSKTALKADFDKIFQRQFDDIKSSNTDNEDIKKLLKSDEDSTEKDKKFGGLPNDDQEEFGNIPNCNKDIFGVLPNVEFGILPNANKNSLVKYQTGNPDELCDVGDDGVPKDIKHKDNIKNNNNVRNVIDINSQNRDTEDNCSDVEEILSYARQKIIVNQLAYESLIRQDLENHEKEVLIKAIDLAVEQQEENDNYKRGDPKNGVDIGSWRYIQCFIEEAKEKLGLKGGNGDGASQQSNRNEQQKDYTAGAPEGFFKN